MPLAFESTTHGTVAFGFFNIDSDMLLLENRFFFATDFCKWMTDLCKDSIGDTLSALWEEAWTIDNREDVGDLMGAIQGYRHTGFIGDTYLRYPFPGEQKDFKQKPEGDATRAEIAGMIEKYARREEISFSADRGSGSVKIGGIRFTTNNFHELVRYVWRGGYPRWRDEVRPEYVMSMKQSIEESGHWLFHEIDWKV